MSIKLNILPPDHTREDFDFTYKSGEVGPIRINAYVNAFGKGISASVWCIKHCKWEDEITSD